MKPKRKMGRPLKFQSLSDMETLIDKYFRETPEQEWTVTGLALALDTSRETLINYEARDEFFDCIKRAKLRVHHAYEKDLRKRGRTTDIFALKNFGWTDQRNIDHTTAGKPIPILGGASHGVSTDDSDPEDTQTSEED